MGTVLTEADVDRLTGVERLHVVFKTHLDLGFTDLAERVRGRYLDDYLPRAIELARRTRETDGRRFVWTVGSWLVYESLEHGSSRQRRDLERAVADGDITWTAMPFTPHSELMGRDLFELGLDLSRRLDERFGTNTIAANLTDVPGHTIGVVPLLAAAGVRLLHIGVNPGSPLPDVPAAFRWRVPGRATEITVSYNDDYGGVTRLGSSPDALLLVFTDDNIGPPAAAGVAAAYAELENRLPRVAIDTTGMNAFARTIDLDGLPVVERELGDSWLHGGATDPAKLGAYRELVRLRREWLASGNATPEELDAAYRTLMLVAEHTWGLDVKSHRRDELPESWAEQRAYVEQAVRLLPARLAGTARTRLQEPPAERSTGAGALPLLLPVATYQAFGAGDYTRFHREYLRSDDPWALADFGKPDLAKDAPSGSWTASAHGECELVFPHEAVELGAPGRLTYEAAAHGERAELVVRWFDKKPMPTPEALWLTFTLPAARASGWTLDKLGVPVSALGVDVRGGQLHAVERWVRYHDEERELEIELLDTPIVSFLGPRLLRFDARSPTDGDGLSVCLWNNVWGTNFPQWYGEPGFARFRFRLNA